MREIQTPLKVTLPPPLPDLQRRTRLVDFLHQNVDKRLILVCAEAGSGKTALLVDFAHSLDLPVCWYSVDASDADPAAFLRCLILSIRQRFPNFGNRTQALLDSVEQSDTEISTVVASLADDIRADISTTFLLVLDNFEHVADSCAVNLALDELLSHLPENCHFVVSTRTLPSLTYSRLAAQRQVVGLGTKDLRFTADELSGDLRP